MPQLLEQNHGGYVMLLTGRERILLHLHEKSRGVSPNSRVMPAALSQEGISEATGIARKHVPRNLKVLMGKELINEGKAHVSGTSQRRRVYIPTQSGREEARAVRDKVLATKLTFRTRDGEREVDLKRAMKDFGERNPDARGKDILFYLDLLAQDGGKEFLDEEKALASLSGDTVVVKHLGGAPAGRKFVGRDKELKDVQELLNVHKMVVIYGITGIGKTALGVQLARDYKGSVFWHSFHEWDTVMNFLGPMNDFLEEMGCKGLGLKENVTDINAILSVLKERLQGTGALVVLDDIQKASQEFKPLFRALSTNFLESLEDAGFMVLGRKIPDFYSRREVVVNKTIGEYMLEGLDKESCSALLEGKGLGEGKGALDKIYDITCGHPLCLELLEAHGKAVSPGVRDMSKEGWCGDDLDTSNLRTYFEEEVFSHLTGPEKEVLNQASVYRYPVAVDGLLLQPDLDFQNVSNLVRRALVIQTQAQDYFIHDLLKSFVFSRLSRHQRTRLHRSAARFHLGQEEEDQGRKCIEVLHHLFEAGETMKAVEVIMAEGRDLLFWGYGRELHEYISRVDQRELPGLERADLLTLHAETDTVMGDWTGAESHLRGALDIYRIQDNKKGIAPVLKNLGGLHLRKGETKEAVGMFQESLGFYQEIEDQAGVSQIQNNLGVAHWQGGEIDKAKKALESSLEISESSEDQRGIARCITNLGIIEFQHGDLDRAISHYNKALALSEELGDRKTMAQLYDNLGEAFRLKGDKDRALDYFDQGIELAETLGFRPITAQLYLDMSVLLEGEEKEKFRKLAKEIFQELGVKVED